MGRYSWSKKCEITHAEKQPAGLLFFGRRLVRSRRVIFYGGAMKAVVAFVLTSVLLLGLLSCHGVSSQTMYRNGAVVCSDQIAAEVGLQALRDGGNAVDAACATAFALAVTYPQAGNIGGGGFALIYLADSQKVYFLDFRETAPASITPNLYFDSTGNLDTLKSRYGPLSAGVPGTVAGLYEMHTRFGGRPWAEAVHPARILADSGFMVGRWLAESVAEYAVALRRHPAAEALFFPGGRQLAEGDVWVQSDLVGTLQLIEEKGPDGFYGGETAEKLARYCAENGGVITTADLQAYRPVWRQPVRFRFRDLDIYTTGLPSSGGVVMGQILGMLGTFDLEQYGAMSPEYIHLFTEAARRAYADRAEYLGDPAFISDPVPALLSAKYISARGAQIDPRRATPSTQVLPGMGTRQEGSQTTHLVTADRRGNIVSLTYTINESFGAKAVVPGCGYLLNNEMDDFAILAGVPNTYGLIGADANKIEPGKRMLSSMSPTIIFKENRPYLALGSPGGSRIITAVAQTIINYNLFGMPLAEAVSAPRFHHQWQPDKLFLERGGYSPDVIRRLADMGHIVEEQAPFCEVMALGFVTDGWFMTGAADPRRAGWVAGY
jgi:gamma-glutamyltranspeptidase/glutathione hydrolase